jgi:hypothetical protein
MWIVRQHPFISGSGVLLMGLLALVIAGQMDLQKEQPVAVFINASGTALEVKGERGTKLWDIPLNPRTRSQETDELTLSWCTRFSDIDNDGSTEVITGAPYLDGDDVVQNMIRIFDRSGGVRYLRLPGLTTTFEGARYTSNFSIKGILVLTPPGTREKKLFVVMSNDRSPSCLLHMTLTGEVMGEYWHFGWMRGPHRVSLRGGAHDFILLAGVNDTQYRSYGNYPAFAILNPFRILGRTESQQTRGFGFAQSQAEEYYGRAGDVDARLIAGQPVPKARFGYATKIGQDSSFTLQGIFGGRESFPNVMYTFNASVALVEAWLTDSDRASLTSQFLIRKTPEGQMAFTRDLEAKVRWWDGRSWQATPIRIAHPKPPS